MVMQTLILFLSLSAPSEIVAWEFELPKDAAAWGTTVDLADVTIANGVMEAKASGLDPFWLNRTVSFPARAHQCVHIRIKATQGGTGELFWSGSLEGQDGGLTQAKRTGFLVEGKGEWEDIVVFPGWHLEGTIRQLRLDVYEGARFAVDWIRILDWSEEKAETPDPPIWTFGEEETAWEIVPGDRARMSPPLHVDISELGWATVQLTSEAAGSAALLWISGTRSGVQQYPFEVRRDEAPRFYNIELAGLPAWEGPIVALGVMLPGDGAGVRLESIRLGREPFGPPELETAYFGFENAPNRAGRPCRLLARITNQSGGAAPIDAARLEAPEGLRIAQTLAKPTGRPIEHGEYEDFVWEVVADQPGTFPATLHFGGKYPPDDAHASLAFSPARPIEKAEYVPVPKPVATEMEICAYYFPGWDKDAKWDCIRRLAPIRKPMLGYYDEGNPECVDWQIKWVVENGISCFLVDWYWRQGSQALTHWFEAYRKARFRDQLKVAIMWANHLPPGSHTEEDWRAVTDHWIEHYFSLDSYYRIDGKPAIFLWDPKVLRRDLGGSEQVRACLAASQAAAREAGFEGITFVALDFAATGTTCQMLAEEGYAGITSYHERGAISGGEGIHRRLSYADVVTTVAEAWARKDENARPLTYYPVADTGWDARPWHGERTLVVEGRTPDRFERVLRAAKAFCEEHDRRILVIGPLNEWGEGSYIEPCTQYGFEMYERIRRVFALGDPASWPENIAPCDVGLGPYPLEPPPLRTAWDFDDGPGGWLAGMNIAALSCREGALRMRTTTDDPALSIGLGGAPADEFRHAEIGMTIEAAGFQEDTAQLFWATGGSAITEATSVRFTVVADGQPHTYRVDLATSPRWRGRISTLRFDPCTHPDIEIALDFFRLAP